MLDYAAKTGAFIMRVPRSNSALIQSLMNDHGFNFSLPSSTNDVAFLFTYEPYAACAFVEGASPAALEQLNGYLKEIEASRATEGPEYFRVPPGPGLCPFQLRTPPSPLPPSHSAF